MSGADWIMAEDTQKRIAELEAKREARLEAIRKARDEQRVEDLEAINPVLEELGDDAVEILELASFRAGLPTLVVVKHASQPYSRYRDMARRAGKNLVALGTAVDLLAEESIAWPDKATYARMKEEWSGLHDRVGLAAIRLGESEGKG